MLEFWQALDNREKALLIWTLVIFVWVLWKKDLRSSFGGVLRALAARPLSLLLLGAMLYVAAIVLAAAAVGVWTVPLFGVTVLWCLGPAAVMFFNANRAAKGPHYLRRVLRGTFTWVLIVEFLATLSVFNLVVELILLPLVTLLVLTAYVADTRPEFAPVKKLLDVLLTFFGIALLAQAGLALATEFDHYATLENLIRLVLPPALTVAFLPYMYLLLAYVRRDERRFDRLRRERLAGYARATGAIRSPISRANASRLAVAGERLERDQPAA